MFKRLRHYLMVGEEYYRQSDPEIWRQSALRILTLSGFCLVGWVGIHSGWQAFSEGLYHIPVIVFCFYSLLAWILLGFRGNSRSGARLFIFVIYLAALCILLFIRIPEVARMGVVFLYMAPLTIRVYFGVRAAIWAMGCNFIPFFIIATKYEFPNIFGVDMTLEDSHLYISSLIFLFFNFCVPLSAFRVYRSLEENALRREQDYEKMRQMKIMYEDIFQNYSSALIQCDRKGRIQRVNREAEILFDGQKYCGISVYGLLDFQRDIRIPLCPGDSCKARFKPSAGDWIEMVAEVVDARQDNLLYALRDVTELKRMMHQLQEVQEQAVFLRGHDHLTGLYNQESFCEAVMQQYGARRVHYLCIRIAHLRYINHKYGNTFGDGVLCHVAAVLRASAAQGSMVYGRLRGSLFIIASESHGDVDFLRRQLPKTITLKEKKIFVEYCFGLAVARGKNAQKGIQRVEMVIQQQNLEDLPVYHEGLVEKQILRRDMEIHLRAAISDHELTTFIQPKVNSLGEIVGGEALVRWLTDRPYASPAQFIPLAEDSGLIYQIDLQVMEDTAILIKNINTCREKPLTISVNLSTLHFLKPGIADHISLVVQRHGIRSEWLQIELTETCLMSAGEVALAELAKLKKNGHSIAMDDFGVGYSSLKLLAELPITTLKLDRSFVSGLPDNPRQTILTQTILTMGRELGFEVVAEGVETRQQLEYLRGKGCDLFQGFFFYRPMPADDFVSLCR
ncbi:bifunctional diguanylate cyclase/phosphodiesterase [Desulfobotulus sp. H1]|uniref:Bifunctional diguanylate cyclase/phosphodiesterase n=1 Tax=Desulfobotulus pelophilus TaxID=2823377 RepID=A0ABT3N9C6_9BACT|nr:bifunctional diguanylate cyclase/phosphodiesterase [Desulfobotulus pelophilus]MCW7754054.1 bifunctional diguanylate cyclase/phosphodiesterase [Desulfobotulus pelophilus]